MSNASDYYADSVLNSIEEMWTRYDEALGNHDYDMQSELDEYPLELIARRGSLFAVVITVGGPDARIVWDGRYGTDNAVLVVRWGTDVVERIHNKGVRRMAEYFGELMDSDEDMA